MTKIKRLYQTIIDDHLQTCRQMIFLPGPRQVGKTTLVKQLQQRYELSMYLNWDNIKHRTSIQRGYDDIESTLKLNTKDTSKRLLIFDELHKYPFWKNWLKGLFDTYEDKLAIVVTGSAMLSVYRKGQDSMMGRYFPYRIHPLSVAELV